MNIELIQTRVDAMAKAMAGKCIEPEAEFVLCSAASFLVKLCYFASEADKRNYRHTFKRFKADTIANALTAADAYIAAMPNREDQELAKYRVMLADTIEQGRKVGGDVTALLAAMTDLSKNMLPAPVAVADQRPWPIGAGLPF